MKPLARRGQQLTTVTDEKLPHPCAPSRFLPATLREADVGCVGGINRRHVPNLKHPPAPAFAVAAKHQATATCGEPWRRELRSIDGDILWDLESGGLPARDFALRPVASDARY